MKILILNGPNLNLLGRREPEIYGNLDFDTYFSEIKQLFPTVHFQYFQSNHEGLIIDKLHEVGFSYDGIVLNAGAFTHTSLALGDAVAAIDTPVIEVHISNVYNREPIRHHSLIAKHCAGCISGFGLNGYRLAIESFL